MDHRANLIGGIGIGIALMYYLDPDRGERRRKLIADQLRSAVSRSDDMIGKTARDLRNRARGLVAETQAQLRPEAADDVVLVERVRAQLGRVVSHPHALEITAAQGRVTLRGPIFAHEVDQVLSAVRSVRGVSDIDNQLEVHRHADGVPGLQGGRPRPGLRPELMQENWAPAARLLVGAGGGALLLYGLNRRDAPGIALGALGGSMLARSLANVEMERLIGVGGGRRAVDVHKTITINAPLAEVFAFWTNYDHFPRFMSNLIEVRDLGNGRSHWVAKGPGGVPVEWDAMVTQYAPEQVLAWRSEEGSTVANAGILRFQPVGDASTRVDIQLAYNPPGGVLGHAIARLFGADPKSQMDDDLVRLKSLLEHGKASSKDTTVTREEIADAFQRRDDLQAWMRES